MSEAIKILRFIFALFMIAMFTSCASSKKNPYYEKRKHNSHINTSQLGRNRYYYSPNYQKKLIKSYKRK